MADDQLNGKESVTENGEITQNSTIDSNVMEPRVEQSSISVPFLGSDESNTTPVSINSAASDAMVEPSLPADFRQGSMEANFYKMLMSPLMAQMEESVNKSNEILDDLMSKMQEEREQTKKKQMSLHIPLMLQGCGRDLPETIGHMENLIHYENYDPEQNDTGTLVRANLRDMDSTAEMSVIGHSIAAYVSTLESHHLKHLATKVVSDVSVWMSRIFRYPEAAAHFHEEEKEGLVKICQLAIHKKYPKYASDGYEVLYPRPPVIYISASAKHNLGQYLCHQIGLPLGCLCTVPCRNGHMDLNALQKLIEDDNSSGKTPVIIIAYAGTPLLGRTDNINRLHELCRLHDIWLHLEGSSLLMLSYPTIPSFLTSAPLCNSMTLNISAWLGLPAVPFVTLFRSPDVVLTRAVGLSTFNVRYKLNCTSLWLCMLNLGYDGILARLQYHTHLASAIHRRLENTTTDNKLVLFNFESPSVVFRYQIQNDQKHNGESDASNPNHIQEDGRRESSTDNRYNKDRDQYCDTLNIWLAETLKREIPEVHVTAVEVENIGMCIRYAPLETSYTLNSWSLFDTNSDDMEQFLDCLDHHIKILDATVGMRRDFEDIVESQDNIRLVSLPTWAGLGAVQYIPETWLSQLDNLPEQGKQEINLLNHQMVHQLKSNDAAFSLGQTESGLYCVRFGLVTEDSDLEELIAMVYTTGKDVEESSKVLENMSDAIRRGIEKAAEDLQKENQDKLVQEGVLRQVPLVGSLINWWSPPPKDAIKGRTFNLASGKINSTEETYKSHMQILETMPELTTKREGPLKANLKPARGRSTDMQRSHSNTSSDSKIVTHNEAAGDAVRSANETPSKIVDTSVEPTRVSESDLREIEQDGNPENLIQKSTLVIASSDGDFAESNSKEE